MLASAADVAVGHTPGWSPYWPNELLAADWAAAGPPLTPFSRRTRRGHRHALAALAPALAPAPQPQSAAPEPSPAQPDDGADAVVRQVR
ncbi:hypothetical protein AQJ11_35980 [Streptomyces corchorusii]|uniref:Uncharacterized protein n=2 Tax=Streptomyces TaxID=1883 RepID=A0A124HJZ5_STRCK|nr:hypothetical protein [Streptomyces corchorusii]KUN18059.1 hypothetical protein AQJ11_35980 [Streptomyces corchorusii]